MTNEELQKRIDNGEWPCEVVEVATKAERRLKSGQMLCVVPPEELHVRADEEGFVQIINGTVVAEWTNDEIFWVRSA